MSVIIILTQRICKIHIKFGKINKKMIKLKFSYGFAFENMVEYVCKILL